MKPVKEQYQFLKEKHIPFTGSHDAFTPQAVVDPIIKNINTSNREVLVLFNIEFVISLVYTYNVDPTLITFFADHENKIKFAKRIGVTNIKYVEPTLPAILEAIRNHNMKTRPVLLVNPPYTNGEQDASEIYTAIINNCIDQFDPIAIGAVTPENMINGGQKKKTLREKILKKYGLTYLSFLNQKVDWNGDISIDTVSWVVEDSHTGPTTVIGRNQKQTYTVKSKLDEYINGETQNIHDWLLKIQTTDKIKLLSSKKTNKTGTQIKISKDFADSIKIETGNEYDSHNTEWRVAFGYMRCNTCAVVPPGVSIPSKYRYINFGASEDNARKFRCYMLSEPVRFIMKLIYTSRTLDNPQLAYVPKLDMSKFSNINDATLYQFWKVDTATQTEIKTIVGVEVPF
jgi:hypothetical protein